MRFETVKYIIFAVSAKYNENCMKQQNINYLLITAIYSHIN